MMKLNKMLLVISLVLFGILISKTWADNMLPNPPALEMFVDELVDMPRISGFDAVNGVPVPKSLTIGMFYKIWKFHRDLPPTPVFAYGTSRITATVPGPTIEALHGVDTYVTWQNHLPSHHILPWDPTIPTTIPRSGRGIPTVVHLHGGIDEVESDGHAFAWFTAEFKERGPNWTKKMYRYTNNQHPGNLWYHDHAMGLTRVNLLAGLVGSYIVHDHAVEAPLGLPHGPEFDRPLIFFDRIFRTNGSIYMNSTGNNPSVHPQWQPEYFGDTIVVNGKAWPRMTVRRRKYRFRIINASNARFFSFYFSNGLEFIHIGSDSSYNERPVVINKMVVAPSEIADVVVDFSKSNSDSVILANDAPYPYPTGSPVNQLNSKIMKFVIKPGQETDPSKVPNNLLSYPSPDLCCVSQTRYITMYEYLSKTGQPTHLYLNNKPLGAPVTETPKEGSSEIWNVINLTGDNHPLHIHLGLFTVLEQRELINLQAFTDCMTKLNDAVMCNISEYAVGKTLDVVAHEKGWKNVYKMVPGYVTKIFLRFSYIHTNASYPFDATKEPGYVYHCHILDHEDNEMMRPLKLIH